MSTNFTLVKDFMGIMKQKILPTPALTDEATAALRVDLIEEELDEPHDSEEAPAAIPAEEDE